MTDITHLDALIDDSERALRSGDTGPADPTNYGDLMGRLVTARDSLPPAYRTAVWEPFVGVLQQIGEPGFVQILLQDPQKQGLAGLVLDAAHAILQNGERYEQNATDGFQEVVADLYDGFLSAEDRRGVKPPDQGTLAPLVKWGQPDFGPYTFTINATRNLGMGAAIVNMPPANARGGMLAWAALPHEVAGHDLMHADTGLHAELQDVVRDALSGFDPNIARYWADRIDETASDVMGIMNMGPAAAIGLVGYFRSIQSVQGRGRRLSSVGFARGEHPAGLLRGYLAAGALRLCEAPEAQAWADTIEAEVNNDAEDRVAIVAIKPGNPPSLEFRFEMTRQQAKESAEAVALAIVSTPLKSLEGSSIGAIQNWRHEDEIITQHLANILGSNKAL